MTPDEAVAEEFAALLSNRSRRQALEELDRVDLLAAEAMLGASAAFLQCLSPTERSIRELQLLESKQALLKSDHNRAGKGLRRESLRSSLDVCEKEDDNS